MATTVIVTMVTTVIVTMVTSFTTINIHPLTSCKCFIKMKVNTKGQGKLAMPVMVFRKVKVNTRV